MSTEDRVWQALNGVSDPEYPLSLVDMGMIYGVAVKDSRVIVTMTFTSIGCPAIDMLTSDVREAVDDLPEVENVDVEVVWDPPWTHQSISPKGKRVLEMYGVVN